MNLVWRYTAATVVLGSIVAVLWLVLVPTIQAPVVPKPPLSATDSSHSTAAVLVPEYPFIEVVDSCGPHYEGTCVTARAEPNASSTVVERLRTGTVLAVATSTVTDDTGRTWYQVVFNEWIRYPYRTPSTWYVASDTVHRFTDPGDQQLAKGPAVPEGSNASTTKRIVIDRTKQMLYAYDGDTLFMESPVSTGLDLTPTPRGTFTVYQKTPSRYMQGPLPGISDQYYDLPGVPWNLYFTLQGGAIHGTYWHTEFGQEWSHGCVNLPIEAAKQLYEWTPLGTAVVVRD